MNTKKNVYTHTHTHTRLSHFAFCYTADIKDNIVNHLYFNKIKQTNNKKTREKIESNDFMMWFCRFFKPKGKEIILWFIEMANGSNK